MLFKAVEMFWSLFILMADDASWSFVFLPEFMR